ncbi:hypothetical protein [Marinomonas balearica]|uniref:Uncharacterized protein n=1 Tax=Marinomonas balearica TaxID=491947 RepID=A0A4R6M7Y5_9GAMM|nr:hypothetical protein [Marinomonas balearica]TDO97444.1 hypothetical protein DFP79_2263 [Marinomonas balearica]
MDINKVITALFTTATVGLVTAIYGLNTSVAELSKQIAVMEERYQNTTKERIKREETLKNLGLKVRQQDERINRLEWQYGK